MQVRGRWAVWLCHRKGLPSGERGKLLYEADPGRTGVLSHKENCPLRSQGVCVPLCVCVCVCACVCVHVCVCMCEWQLDIHYVPQVISYIVIVIDTSSLSHYEPTAREYRLKGQGCQAAEDHRFWHSSGSHHESQRQGYGWNSRIHLWVKLLKIVYRNASVNFCSVVFCYISSYWGELKRAPHEKIDVCTYCIARSQGVLTTYFDILRDTLIDDLFMGWTCTYVNQLSIDVPEMTISVQLSDIAHTIFSKVAKFWALQSCIAT